MTDLREKVSQAIRISMHSATGRERDAANRAADAAIKAVLDALKGWRAALAAMGEGE
ncbi:hypothetical protein WBP06_09405 [Novosphingobium sp. BL-8H]|uniref:hypothetical protein n=1 Tax=Novosphingobium sp. BL-8H TaxID=3127640 RepID=UPI0037573196